jgi:hypothetical protein
MTNQRIQLHVLAEAVKGRDVLRRDVVAALSVKPKAVDEAMARCNLVRRVTSNNGAAVRYRIAY